VTHAVVESSSHGLALRKLDHCAFDAAIVTNVAADHLDFHGTREAYLAAKARLLELTGASPAKPGRGLVVLNADDRSHDELRPLARGKVISFGIERAADLRGQVQEATALGSRVRLHGRLGEAALWVPVPGSFNVANALGAIACAVGLGVRLERACAALAGFRGVPGRMEPVNAGQPFAVIVDYAHTGQSFRKLLHTLRPLTAGRIITVFGSAGEQSHERRAGMGMVAADLADFAVLTTEDPRHEDPDAVIDGIARAMLACGRREGSDFVRVTDRRAAIRVAFERACPGDLVVLAGKGHEQSIIVGDEQLPWDERRVAEACLADLGYSVTRSQGAERQEHQGA
jgi:UDP-N-acetylmuramoyl-L-alanyl-D-glutamate--2,6-diaminopimelate ligase